jgi:hypothetical protein
MPNMSDRFMLRVGKILLSLWTGLNLALALGILFMMLVMGRNAPCLLVLFGDTQAAGMDPRALATINGLAVLFNACAAAVCGLSLAVMWIALRRGWRWAFWSLTVSLGFLQAAGFASDSFFQHKDFIANVGSSMLLLAGIGFTAAGVFRRSG